MNKLKPNKIPKKLEYHRKPTAEEIKFGHGAIHYREFMSKEFLKKDGTIKKTFIEPGYSDDCPSDPFEVSDADTMLDYLKSR